MLAQTNIPGYDRSMANLEEREMRVWRAFLGVHSRVIPLLDSELAREMNLNLSQYEVLLWLNDAPGASMRMSELAAKIVLSPSGVTRAVDQLERRGLVERKICDSDRRGYLAALTREGRSQLRRASNTHVRGIREHFTGKLTERQMDQLADLLEVVGSEVAAPPCDIAS